MTDHYIEAKHLELVRKILNSYHHEFYIFGSRAKGTHQPLSDLDILSKSPLSKLQISQINEQFEESKIPYKVDLVIWDELDELFRSKIQSDLKKIF